MKHLPKEKRDKLILVAIGTIAVVAGLWYSLVSTMRDNLKFRAGVNNIFDKDPPVQGLSQGNGNTYPQMFDSMGRYLFAGFTVDF